MKRTLMMLAVVAAAMLAVGTANADPGPTDEVIITHEGCDVLVHIHNTSDVIVHWIIRIDGKVVESDTIAPDEIVERKFTVPQGETQFFRARLGLTGEHVYFSNELTVECNETSSTPPPTTSTPPPTTSTPPPTTTTTTTTTTTVPPTTTTTTFTSTGSTVTTVTPSPLAVTGGNSGPPAIAAGVLTTVGLALLALARKRSTE